MKLHTTYLEGAVLPTVVVAALVMLTATLGLLALWEQETLLFTRTQRLRQARADVESAALLYRLHPDERALTAAGGYLLYDSLPQSRIFVRREPWGLYELLHITTADSLVASSRIVGAEPDPARTLFYADDRTAVTLAGDTRLHGTLRLPQNGLTYGRVGAEFYRGEEVPRTAIRSSAAMLPAPSAAVAARIGALFAFAQQLPAAGDLPDSLGISFRDPTVALRLGTAEIGGCTLRGRIVLAADELRIDSACRLENVLVCARKITVGSGARIAAQLFARDTVVVEPCAVLEYPSGICAGRYAELGDRATADGYVIVPRHRAAQEDGRLLPPVAHGTCAGASSCGWRGAGAGDRRGVCGAQTGRLLLAAGILQGYALRPYAARKFRHGATAVARRRRDRAQKGGRMRRVKRASGGRLRAASLVEAVVAAVLLLIVFTAAMELLPRLTLRGDDALAVAEAEYRAMCAFDKYGSGVWPAGTYVERYGGGEATVRVEPYRQYRDVQLITIEVRIDGSRKRIVHRQLVECAE